MGAACSQGHTSTVWCTRYLLWFKARPLQYYNSHGNSPDQYAMNLVGALNASNVPLIVELPQGDTEPMFSSSALPEVDNGATLLQLNSAWIATILPYEHAHSRVSHHNNDLC